MAEPDATTPDESALLARVAGGDRRAFEQLYRVWAPRVFRFVDRMLGDHARSEEVTDDVMLEIWKSAPRFEGRSRPSTWALGIARLKALSELRARRPAAEEIDEASAPADPAEAADERLAREASAARVRAALGSLSAEQREVVELTFFHGLAYDEIAALVGCPLGTVKTRMFHARKRLAPLLAGSAEETP